MFDVFEIILHFFGEHGLDVDAVGVLGGGEELFFVLIHDRRERGDAGRQQQGGVILRLILLHIARHLGSGAHKRHAAAEHVEDLGQLVQTVFAQDSAYFGDAAVAVRRDLRAERLGVLDHGAELEDPEMPSVGGDAFLTEKDVSR